MEAAVAATGAVCQVEVAWVHGTYTSRAQHPAVELANKVTVTALPSVDDC